MERGAKNCVSDQPSIVHLHCNSKKGAVGNSKPEPRKGLDDVEMKVLAADQIETLNENWNDNEKTSLLWEVIKEGQIQEFVDILAEHPDMAHVRSSDGRGPMWWAHEYGRPKMIDVLRQLQVSEDRADSKGVKPTDITHSRIKGGT